MNLRINSCPCCGNSPLRHVRHGEVYWFCTSCWQEVPLLSGNQTPRLENTIAARSRPLQPVKF